MSPQNCLFLLGICVSSMHGLLDPCESAPKTASRYVSRFCTAHLCARHTDTHTQTDHATCDVCNNKPHLYTACRQCGL